MNGFSGLSYTQIDDIANQLDSKSTAMQTLLTEIENQLKKVGDDGTWSGTAASSAFEEFNSLIQKFPEFTSAVKSCSTHLKAVVANYKAVDSAVRG